MCFFPSFFQLTFLKYVFLGIKYCYLLNPALYFLNLIEGVCVGGKTCEPG